MHVTAIKIYCVGSLSTSQYLVATFHAQYLAIYYLTVATHWFYFYTVAVICRPVGCVYASQCHDQHAKQLLSYKTHSFKNWWDILLL